MFYYIVGGFSCNFLVFDASENRLICYKGRFAVLGSSEQIFRLMCRNRRSDLASQRPKTAAGRDEVKSIIICQGCLPLRIGFYIQEQHRRLASSKKDEAFKAFLIVLTVMEMWSGELSPQQVVFLTSRLVRRHRHNEIWISHIGWKLTKLHFIKWWFR